MVHLLPHRARNHTVVERPAQSVWCHHQRPLPIPLHEIELADNLLVPPVLILQPRLRLETSQTLMIRVQHKRPMQQVLPTLAQRPRDRQHFPVPRVVEDFCITELPRHVPHWYQPLIGELKQHSSHAQPRRIRLHHKVTPQIWNNQPRRRYQLLADIVKLCIGHLRPDKLAAHFLLHLQHVRQRDDAARKIRNKLPHVVREAHKSPDLVERLGHWKIPQSLHLVLSDLDVIVRDVHAEKIHRLQCPLTLGRIEIHFVVTEPLKHNTQQHNMLLHRVAGVRQIIDVTHHIVDTRNNIFHEQLITGWRTLQSQTRHIEKVRPFPLWSETRERRLLPVFYRQRCLIETTEVIRPTEHTLVNQ